jgi:hypothetical protein
MFNLYQDLMQKIRKHYIRNQINLKYKLEVKCIKKLNHLKMEQLIMHLIKQMGLIILSNTNFVFDGPGTKSQRGSSGGPRGDRLASLAGDSHDILDGAVMIS